MQQEAPSIDGPSVGVSLAEFIEFVKQAALGLDCTRKFLARALGHESRGLLTGRAHTNVLLIGRVSPDVD